MLTNSAYTRQEAIHNKYAEEPMYAKYAEETPQVTSKGGIKDFLNEQGIIIGELAKNVSILEEHLSPITSSHPMRSEQELSASISGDSEIVTAIRIHNNMIISILERIADIRTHTQI